MSESDNVQSVRDRIIALAREIEQLSQTSMSPEAFFSGFLGRVVGAIGAQAGAVWMLNGQKQLALFCEQDLRETGFYENPQASTVNQRLLVDVMGHGQACTRYPDDRQDTELPTQHLIVLAALQREKECVGVVEIFQRPDTPAQARPGFLQFVEQMCGYACRYLEKQAAAPVLPARTEVSEEFEQFLLELHRSLDAREVAAVAANDGRLLLDCDRLSVAVQYGKKTVVKAISGQESVNQRANLVRRMTAMASKVILMRETLTYTGKLDHLPPQVEEPLADYIQESGSRMVMIVPLFEPEPIVEEDEDDATGRRKEKQAKPIGGLIVEQVAQSQPKPELMDKVELIADHVAGALSNARVHERLFLLPLWRLLGRCFRWLEGRSRTKVLGVVAIVIAAVLAMIFVPYPYRVEGEGKLMPVIQREVFAPWDGEVVEIYVKSGDHVEEGQPLLKLRNDDLQAQLVAARNELAENRELLAALGAERDEALRTAQGEDKIRLEGQIVKTRIEIDAALEQMKILEGRTERLTVRAPLSGVMPTFQVDQLLMRRPVHRGEKLMEVMDETGPWRLELTVEEKRMGHILRAQQQLDKQDLDVEYYLATNVETTYDGHLERMATRTNASAEAGSIVEVYASIDADTLPNRRIGAEVRAKINCGIKSLGYVLFGDVVEFFQRYFWL